MQAHNATLVYVAQHFAFQKPYGFHSLFWILIFRYKECKTVLKKMKLKV